MRRSTPRAVASSPNTSRMPSTSSTRSTGACSRSRWPASIFEKSRMSSMMPSSENADARIVRTASAWSSARALVGQHLDHADDAVHRRADLVAHGRQERRLGAVGGLGVEPGGVEPAVRLGQFGGALDHPGGERGPFAAQLGFGPASGQEMGDLRSDRGDGVRHGAIGRGAAAGDVEDQPAERLFAQRQGQTKLTRAGAAAG